MLSDADRAELEAALEPEDWEPPMSLTDEEVLMLAGSPDTTGAEVLGNPTWLRGSWMQTYTGRQFYPLAPKAEDIDPRDIAHALSMICRYNGHTREFYSVAEHSLHVSNHVPDQDALWGLLHDAAEAYIGDMARPLKHSGAMEVFRDVERNIIGAIAERFGIPYEGAWAPSIKDADSRILLDERAVLLTAPPEPWAQEDLEPLGVTIVSYWPKAAEERFLARLGELT